MQLLAGTSGFSYKEWVGEFYPDKLRPKRCSRITRRACPIVEINNTFYRMPNAAASQAWRAQVPDSFRFAIKVPRRISHIKRLRDCGEELRILCGALADLAPCLGSLLVQLPPHARCDEAALAAFLTRGSRRDARRVRVSERVVARAGRVQVARVAQRGARPERERRDVRAAAVDGRLGVPAASPGRLHGAKISHRWLDRIAASGVAEAQVFFKHEDGATGPKLAAQLLAMAGQR